MATVNFSVPDEVKAEFDEVFGGENKSAVIADLMRGAIREARRRKERNEIFRKLTRQRAQRPALREKDARAARIAGRP
jgi:metal-responsive CopG/Arc/MetJ family transcriptional regulator